MNCLEFRRACQADPNGLTAAQQEHTRHCAACARFAAAQYAFDRRLAAALWVPAPDNLSARVIFERSLRGRRRRWSLLAVAAVLVLALGVVFAIAPWNGGAMRAQQFIAHMHQDPIEMMPAMAHVDSALAQVDGSLGIRISATAGAGVRVIRAKLCPVDGHKGAHLVFEHNGMRATVFVMPHARALKAGWVKAHGMVGEVVQVGHGLIVVFCPAHKMVAELERQLRAGVHWDAT